MLSYTDMGSFFENMGMMIKAGISVNEAVDLLKEEHPNWFDGSDGWSYNVNEGTYYDYLELRGWAQGDVCAHEDWMAAEEPDYNDIMSEPPMRNALKDFMERVNVYLNAYGIYYPKPNEVIIVCEMSY